MPNPPGVATTHEVAVSLTASGDPSDYDVARQATMASTMARLDGVGLDPSAVDVSVAAGSVLIGYTLSTTDGERAAAIESHLTSVLANASSTSSLLGVPALSAPAITSRSFTTARLPAPPPGLPPSQPPTVPPLLFYEPGQAAASALSEDGPEGGGSGLSSGTLVAIIAGSVVGALLLLCLGVLLGRVVESGGLHARDKGRPSAKGEPKLDGLDQIDAPPSPAPAPATQYHSNYDDQQYHSNYDESPFRTPPRRAGRVTVVDTPEPPSSRAPTASPFRATGETSGSAPGVATTAPSERHGGSVTHLSPGGRKLTSKARPFWEIVREREAAKRALTSMMTTAATAPPAGAAANEPPPTGGGAISTEEEEDDDGVGIGVGGEALPPPPVPPPRRSRPPSEESALLPTHPEYPARAQLLARQVDWSVPAERYTPVEYTHPDVLTNERTTSADGWADPADAREVTPDEWSERRSYEGPIVRDDGSGRPRNPRGRTGIEGRGLLDQWGPNHVAEPVVTRNDPTRPGVLQVMLVAAEGESGEASACKLPDGVVEHDGETVSAVVSETLTEAAEASGPEQELRARILVDALFEGGGEALYTGHTEDPRNTDNAWVETAVSHFHLPDELAAMVPLTRGAEDGASIGWLDLDASTLGRVPPRCRGWLERVAGHTRPEEESHATPKHASSLERVRTSNSAMRI